MPVSEQWHSTNVETRCGGCIKFSRVIHENAVLLHHGRAHCSHVCATILNQDDILIAEENPQIYLYMTCGKRLSSLLNMLAGCDSNQRTLALIADADKMPFSLL